MKHLFKLSGTFLFLCVAAISSAFAQAETGQLSGTVVDQNGAAVPGAAVTIRSTQTGFTRNTTTNDSGYYVIANVTPSTYEISVKSGSFAEYKVTKVVTVASNIVTNVTLSATAVGAVVDVVAGGTEIGEINTTDQAVSEVVNSRQIEALPTITRNPYDFVTTMGNVSEGDNGGRGVGVSINGQRSASTSILLNGGENVDTFTASVGQNVPLDSVEEFRVTLGTFTADTGRATGGVVNLITKSGRNEFFGSGYFFNRASRFASAGFDNNANEAGKDFFNRNQYGFSLGGPIIKNKLLFFSNWEWTDIRSEATNFAMVASPASIAASSAGTQAFFAGYTLFGTPTGRTGTLTGTSGRTFTFNEVAYTVPADSGAGTPGFGYNSANRIDWEVNQNLKIYGVYALDKSESDIGANASSPYAGFNTGFETNNTNIMIAGTYNLGASFVGVSRFTYNKLGVEQPLGEQPAGPTLYMRSSALGQYIRLGYSA